MRRRSLIAHLCETSADMLDVPVQSTRAMIRDIPNTDFGVGGQTARALGR
jgi:phenylpyruvate tautomerase PptA (4-oxalocrotonate tautomerase family)